MRNENIEQRDVRFFQLRQCQHSRKNLLGERRSIEGNYYALESFIDLWIEVARWRLHDQDGNRRMANQRIGYATQREPGNATASMSADYYQIGFVAPGV